MSVYFCSYDGIIVSSLEAKGAFSWYDTWLLLLPESFTDFTPMNCIWGFWHEYPHSSNTNDFSCYSFLQEPFKSIPLIWAVHENALAYRSRQYTTNGQIEVLNDWGRVFNRSTVVVFPNYALPVICMGQIIYLMFDTLKSYLGCLPKFHLLNHQACWALQGNFIFK